VKYSFFSVFLSYGLIFLNSYRLSGLEFMLCFFLISQHIVELLRQQQFLEIFLEGTRSRSGKTSCARAGLLSVVVDALSTNTIPDILIIPVGISYDRIIEGHYNGEQLVHESHFCFLCLALRFNY
jgi:glycerol-3-phosphate O-acyltransferase